jgi:parallel beta-helix repeat protein
LSNGVMMKKPLLNALLIFFVVGGLLFFADEHLGSASGSTGFNGIISSDTTWSKANSPINLNGPVAVTAGATLTIDPGVTVDINSYNILVNGTLRAIGSVSDQIHFTGGYITFGQSSSWWNEQSGSGCIIENAIIDSPQTYSAIGINSSPKISHDTINGGIQVNQNSNCVISNNNINGEIVDSSSGAVTISNNAITNPSSFDEGYGIHEEPGHAIITGNVISNCKVGIFAYSGNPTIINNTISGCTKGLWVVSGSSPEIQGNLITGNVNGVYITSGSSIVQGNTIVSNINGIYIDHEQKYFGGFYWVEPSPTITYNNIYGNSGNSVFAVTTNNVTVIKNWWGTTDADAIAQTIHDNKNDYTVGTVTFVPFLTAPNTQVAVPNQNTTTPAATPVATLLPSETPTPAQNNSPSPTQNTTATNDQPINQKSAQLNWVQIATLVLLGIIAVLLCFAVFYLRKRSLRTS